MIPVTCAREKEVAELLHRGHWPQACAPELRDHVAACRQCSDLVLVTQIFQSARTHTAPPRLESSGALWWRAQLRRRNTALERINRPIIGAQIFAVAVAVILGIGILAWETRRGIRLTAWLHDLNLSALFPTSLEGNLWLIIPLAATLALVSGVILYLTTEKQ
jgi:branched-subunit amino acid ABC-type transport system permease component